MILIGRPEGVVVTSAGASNIWPCSPARVHGGHASRCGSRLSEDAALIVMGADIFLAPRWWRPAPGRERSAAYCCVPSEQRPSDLVRTAGGFCVDRPPRMSRASSASRIRLGICGLVTWWRRWADQPIASGTVDRVVLDMLAPWECVAAVAEGPDPRAGSSAATSPPPPSWRETSRRCVPQGLHRAGGHRVAGPRLACRGSGRRPRHAMVGHTGFLIMPAGWRPAWQHRCASAAQLPARTARITLDRG